MLWQFNLTCFEWNMSYIQFMVHFQQGLNYDWLRRTLNLKQAKTMRYHCSAGMLANITVTETATATVTTKVKVIMLDKKFYVNSHWAAVAAAACSINKAKMPRVD